MPMPPGMIGHLECTLRILNSVGHSVHSDMQCLFTPLEEGYPALTLANTIFPFVVQALQYIQQAIDSGVVHASLFYLKGDLLADGTSAALQALAAYKESHRLRPSWRAMMGCAKAAFKANKRHEVRTRTVPPKLQHHLACQGGSRSTESPWRGGQTSLLGCPSCWIGSWTDKSGVCRLACLSNPLLAKEQETEGCDRKPALSNNLVLSADCYALSDGVWAGPQVTQHSAQCMQALKFAKEAARGREPGALVLLAVVYVELHGRQREGMHCVEAALQLDPWHVEAAVTKAQFLSYVSFPCIVM